MQMSLTLLAVASAALFVSESHGGVASYVSYDDTYRVSNAETGTTGTTNSRESELMLLLRNMPHFGDRISCVPTLKRNDYAVVKGLGAYKIHKRKMTWNEARKVCLAEGAHLAVIDSERKEKLFQTWRVEKGLTGLWMGFHDLIEEGAWVTVTGESVDTMSYHPWASDEPNNAKEGQDCAILWHRGMDDYECNMQEPFVCEIILCEIIEPVTPDTNVTSVA